MPTRIFNSDGSLIPLGLKSVDEFGAFTDNLNQGLRGVGFIDVTPIFQGSSVTGFKGFDKVKNGNVSRSAGSIFDTGELSDFDIALSSPKLLARAKEVGVRLNPQGTRTKFQLNTGQLKKLGLFDLRNSLRAQANNRPVNFMLFDSVETAVNKPDAFSIILPR